ncbi:T3SS effector HopA1 family protein [Paenarthrobacter nitroguajacolicus]|uniref:T3SS effector HopA1 family protein n=1 Tax=Paenarthrobacter nitroguajacolicus TaxID=211146 RepID=UPI000A6FD72A|nr:T3SS effector HopA1 family protein [Paenarthrobacter nitroguajacolicus]
MTVTLNAPTPTSFGQVLASLEDRVSVDAHRLTAGIGSTTLRATSLTELRSQVAGAIYTHLHVGHPGIETVPGTGHQDLAAALMDAIPHRTVIQSASALAASARTQAGTSVQGIPHQVVELSGVKVLFPEEALVRNPLDEIVGVRVPSWRSRATPGFLLALGAHGSVNHADASRLYISCVTASEALEVWPKVLGALAASGLSHQVKTLSSSLAFPRSDAMVIYVSAIDSDAAASLVRTALSSLSAHDTPVSVFTHHVGDRLALAMEPRDPRPAYRGLSFGQHRSRVLADALLRASVEKTDLEPAWFEEAQTARINPHRPGHNTGQ